MKARVFWDVIPCSFYSNFLETPAGTFIGEKVKAAEGTKTLLHIY